MIFKYNIFLIKMSPPPSLGNQCIQSFSNPTFYLSSTIRVYQLSSTRVSTIINYQGINYHQLSTIRVSIIIKYNILFIKISPPPPLLATNAFKDLQIQHSFYQNFPPPLLATNAFKDLQIQHSFYQNFPPPFGNQCIQSFSNTTFFNQNFPPPLSWKPMYSIIFKSNILFIKIPPPLSWQPMLSRIFKSNILFIKIFPPPSLGNQCFQ